MRKLAGRVPRPLALLLAVVALFGITWVLLVPAWGNPDEDAHFAYSQTLAERGELPGKGPLGVSSEQKLSMTFTNTDEVTFIPSAKPEWSRVIEGRWRDAEGAAPRDNGGARNATADYPPGYYLYTALPYKLAGGADIFTRLYAMRLFSVIWLLVTTVAAWLLAGEVFGRRRDLQLVTAAAVGLWPMVVWISAAVNPDSMLIAMWALSTWLAVSLVKRGPSAVRAGALCLCVGLALVTKASALALIPPVAFALVVAAWDGRRRLTVRRAAVAACAVVPLALIAGGWIAVAHHNDRRAYAQTELVSSTAGSAASKAGREARGAPDPSPRLFASYLWQFYLPKLPSQSEITFIYPVVSRHPAYQVWLGGGTAVFGWVNVWLPNWVYALFMAFALLAVAAAAATGVRALRARAWRRGRRTLLAGAMLLTIAGALLAGLHWTDYNMWVNGKPPFLQGRYILPLAPIFALVLAQATRAVPRRFRPGVQGAILAALVAVQLGCLGFVAERYYG